MMIPLLTLFTALQIVDVWTTLRAFGRNPLAYEGNPALRWLMHRIGTVPALIAAKLVLVGIIVALGIVAPRAAAAFALIAVLCGFYAWLGWRNWRKGERGA